MAKNEAKIKFTAETKEFNQSIKQSNDEMALLRAEMKLNEVQMESNGITVDGLKKKHQILQDQLAASESKVEALSQKVKKAEEIYGANSTEVNKLKIQLANAQTAHEKLKGAVDDAGDSAREAGEGFTILKGAMADLVADGISGAIDGLKNVAVGAFNMANDVDSATNTFIAKTGESKESADEFEDAMTSIYNGNYGESFEDIAESMSTVKTTMGDLGTDELEKITTDALVLRDTFDIDVN